jgi:hypothetical protein
MTDRSDQPISQHRYRLAALAGEYGRALIGMVFCFGILAATAPITPIAGLLSGFGALFTLYGVQTLIRHWTVINLSAKGINMRGPIGGALAWTDLRGLSLRYFSTRRDRSGGWMQLKIKGKRRTIRIGSAIADFDRLVLASTQAARARGLTLDAASLENLHTLGLLEPPNQAGGGAS